MFSQIISFICRLFQTQYIQFDNNEEFDPKHLRIKVPKCTFVLCKVCMETYIIEQNISCPCLNANHGGGQ